MSEHSLLSASAAARWGLCPQSIRGPQPNKASNASAEGTFLHGVCEAVLLGANYPDEGTEATVDGFTFKFSDSMREDCEAYVNFIQSRKWLGEPKIEARVHYSKALGVPFHSAWGTADCFGITIEDGNETLEIIDLKMGRKAVDPVRNPQAVLYALGAMERMIDTGEMLGFSSDYPIRVTIIQPRLSYRPFVWETTVREVMEIVADLRPAAQAAVAFAEGTATPETYQQFPEYAGAHCTYCRRKADCKVIGRVATQATAPTVKAFDLEMFKLRDVIRSYLEDLEALAYDQAAKGQPFPGTKLVQGRNSAPKLLMPIEEVVALGRQYGIADRLVETKQVVLTPAKIRDAFKKAGAKQEVISRIVVSYPTAPVLADVNDPRPSYQAVDDSAFTGV